MRLRPDRKTARQEEAKERNTAFKKLSKEEKIAKLDAKLGKGKGAKKQREKLS
jgi:hypothetical protein